MAQVSHLAGRNPSTWAVTCCLPGYTLVGSRITVEIQHCALQWDVGIPRDVLTDHSKNPFNTVIIISLNLWKTMDYWYSHGLGKQVGLVALWPLRAFLILDSMTNLIPIFSLIYLWVYTKECFLTRSLWFHLYRGLTWKSSSPFLLWIQLFPDLFQFCTSMILQRCL